jgi:hypothetical protein
MAKDKKKDKGKKSGSAPAGTLQNSSLKSLIVELKDLSAGKNKMGLAVEIGDVSQISDDDMRELLLGAALEVTLYPKKDVKDQMPLDFEMSEQIKFAAECRSYKVGISDYSFHLSIHKDAIGRDNFGKIFAYKTSKMELSRTGNASKEEPKDVAGQQQLGEDPGA